MDARRRMEMNLEIVERTRLDFIEANKSNDWEETEKKWKTYSTTFELWIRSIERDDPTSPDLLSPNATRRIQR